MATIRYVTVEDAEALLHLRKQIADETPYLLRRGAELAITVQQQQRQIQQAFQQSKHLLLVAEQAGELVGFLMGRRGEPERTQHVLLLVVGVLQAYTRRGIGTALFAETEQWARQSGIHRLELHVLVQNCGAVAFYMRQDFEIEGRMKDAQYIDGRYYDEYLMAKLLS